MRLEVEECQGFASQCRKLGLWCGMDSPSEPLDRTSPGSRYLRLRWLISKPLQYIFVVSSLVCGALLCQLSENNTPRIYWQKIIQNILRKPDKFTLCPSDAIYQYDPLVRKRKQTDLKAEEDTGSRREKNIHCFWRPLITREKPWVSPQKWWVQKHAWETKKCHRGFKSKRLRGWRKTLGI